MLKELEVDFYNKDDFWKKNQDERYEYFKNFLIAMIGLTEITNDEKMIESYNNVHTQLALLIIFLTTTDDERQEEIELKWLDKFYKDTRVSFFSTHEGVSGKA
tara:strand:- start:1308 stop:1616 length:309 start_codon:yes stop_codon:yes gene_type:complete